MWQGEPNWHKKCYTCEIGYGLEEVIIRIRYGTFLVRNVQPGVDNIYSLIC